MAPGRTQVEYWFTLIWGVLLRLALIAGLVYAVYRVQFIIVTVVLAALVSPVHELPATAAPLPTGVGTT